MNPFRSIWMLLTGMGKELDRIQAEQIAIMDSLSLQNKALLEILQIVTKIQAELEPPPAVALVVKITGGTTQGENGMSQVADNGILLFVIEADDSLGNAGAALDSPPVATLVGGVGTVTMAADGLSGQIQLASKPGDKVSVHVDGLAGGKAISGDSDSVDVVVGAAALLKVGISIG